MYPSPSSSSSHHVAGDMVTRSVSPAVTTAATANIATSGSAVCVDALSVSELRAGMQQFLRSSGTLGSLKTQLRSVIVSELLKRQGTTPRMPMTVQGTTSEGGNGGAAGGPGGNDDRVEEEEEDDTWTQRLADALVENHLRHTGRSFSLAIFSSEADVSFKSAGDDALGVLLHLNASTANVGTRRGISFFQCILEKHLRQVGDTRGRPPGYTLGTQTDINDSELSPASLETRLAAVDAKYALCFARVGQSTREEVDRRMEAYRQDIQMQMEQAYQQRLRAFEQQQLLEARREAENHYKLLLQNKMEEWREMERVSVQCMEAERTRLAQARDDMELQRVDLDRRQRELHGMLEERDKTMAAMEGRLDYAKQQIRVLTTQVQQYEELCSVRLAEADAARNREWRRVEDIRRLQAEHVTELQLKDEEIDRLRFRLKSLVAAQAAGAAAWQSNIDGGGEHASVLQDTLMKANMLQQRRQAAAAGSYLQPTSTPSIPSTPPREAAWHSVWNSLSRAHQSPTSITPLAATGAAAVVTLKEGEGGEMRMQSVTSSAVLPTIHADQEPNLLDSEKRDVMGGVSPPPVPTHTASASSVSAVCDTTRTMPKSPPPAADVRSPRTLDDQTQLGCEGNGGGISSSARRNDTTGKAKSSFTPSTSLVESTRSSTPNSSRGNAASPHSSSQSSSSSSSRDERANAGAIVTPSATVPVLGEWWDLLRREETSGRAGIEEDEGTNHRGIVWAANSQRSVLLQREASKHDESDDANRRGMSSLDAYVVSAQRQSMTEHTTTGTAFMGNLNDDNNNIDDDDDDNDDDILFRRRGSSEESF